MQITSAKNGQHYFEGNRKPLILLAIHDSAPTARRVLGSSHTYKDTAPAGAAVFSEL